jgi:hypothetical protein
MKHVYEYFPNKVLRNSYNFFFKTMVFLENLLLILKELV